MRYIQGNLERNQVSFEPLAFDEMIKEDNPVRVIDAFVNMLDSKDLGCRYSETRETGRKPYNPKDLLKLYIYGYFYGIRTSRRLETECSRNIELMWLINKLAPDFKTIADFRRDNKEVVIKIFKEFSVLCNELHLIGKEIVAIDGSKFRACNSRHRNFTKRKVEKMITHYEESAKKYLEILESNDKEDVSSKKPDFKNLQEKLAEAKKRIEELNKMKCEIEESGEISMTDPDSKHMSVSNNGTDIAHNVQIAVDSKNHLVVSVDVTSNAADNGQLYPMSEKAKADLGVEKITVLADKGYYNGKCLKNCEENGVTAIVSKQKIAAPTHDDNFAKDKFTYDKENNIFICPMGKILKCITKKDSERTRYRCKECSNCPVRENCTKNKKGREISLTQYQEYYDKAEKLLNENKSLYKQRQMLVEHVFGSVKRGCGYSYFLLKGNEKVKSESHMHFLIYNLKRVMNIIDTKLLIEVMMAR